MLYEQKFLFSLLLTLIIEIPVVFVFVRHFYRHKEIEISKIVFISFLASALTLPYFWFILPAYVFSRSIYIIVGESLVILAETVIYNQLLKLKLSESFVISLAANGSSILLGLLL